jgi:hypothetical protein
VSVGNNNNFGFFCISQPSAATAQSACMGSDVSQQHAERYAEIHRSGDHCS